MTSLTLTFHDTQFDIVDHNNQPWLRLPQIGAALGYKNPHHVQKIYSSNADEFTDNMTTLVDIETNGGKQQVRIFSLRGCHLIAMFSRTKVAKEFRKWVLDILDKETIGQLPEPKTITKAQQGVLYNRVKTIAKESGKIRAELWSRFQNHFQLASYKDLPADRFDDACAYLDEKENEYSNGVKMLYISEAELEKRVIEKARAVEGELLKNTCTGDSFTLSLKNPESGHKRWLVALSCDGVLTARPLLPDEDVMTERQMTGYLKDRRYIVFKKDDVSVAGMVMDCIPATFLPILIETAVKRLNAIGHGKAL